MELIHTIDALAKCCPEETGCHVLTGVRASLLAGEWGIALRLLNQGIGNCGQEVRKCHPDSEALFIALYEEEKKRLRQLWTAAFGERPLEIDFVCRNSAKLGAIKEAMKLVDIIPVTFLLEECSREDTVRFVVEL
jgi:hypothetical protein